MTSLLQRSLASRSITTLEDYAAALEQFLYQGNVYGLSGMGLQQTQNGQPAEQIANSLEGYAQGAYAANGVVFACMAVRMLVFSGVRFAFQRFNKGRPSDLFSLPDLDVLHQPWVGGTTQDLLVKTILHADLAGNAYWTRADGELVSLRPDWVQIVLEPRVFRGGVLGHRKLGFLYTEGGIMSGETPVPMLPGEVVHFAPYPDPLASYRGMSWLTPVLREIRADGQMTRHRSRYFDNAATPNMIITFDKEIAHEALEKFKATFDKAHRGREHAGETLFLGGGADATVVGSNFQEMDFKTVQGAGETRIAAAAGVPPVIVGLSEGLQGSSLNAGNYGQARRRLADGTAHPLWQNTAGSFSVLVPPPPACRLWYDAKGVPFLREDEKDAAEIAFIRAQTYRQYIDAGYTPESVKAAMVAGDEDLLTHSGLFSVQLQPAGSLAPTANGNGRAAELIVAN